MDDHRLALDVIEALRKGTPPRVGVNLYSVGNERLLEGVKTHHLQGISDRGIIRFISGSWGVGKTHFFRQLREAAFDANCLVSGVELDVNSAALNKFQSVFASIVRQVATPASQESRMVAEAAPLGTVLRESLAWLATGSREVESAVAYEQYAAAVDRLMADPCVDIDFKKMVQKYWETFLPEAPDRVIVEQTRGEILQWFSGEGTVGTFRKRFGVGKVVAKDNAKLMLQSLAGFIRLAGYSGLVILFDEAEQAYSVMRKSALREAHNNLLSLINNIETLPGLFLLYATTPDFYSDPKHGIVIYGALSGRVGKPENRPPRALDTIWNLDAVETKLEDYQEAARKIRGVFAVAYPQSAAVLPTEEAIAQKVAELFRLHPSLAAVRFWRLLVSAVVTECTDHMEGEPRATESLYDDVMDRLRED